MFVWAGPNGAGPPAMQLDLSRFRGQDERLERRYAPAALAFDGEEVRLAAAIDLTGDVRKDGRRVRLTGRIRTVLDVDCGRCLEPYPVPVNEPFDLLFLPASENAGEEEREVEADDLGVSFYQDEAINLRDVVREQLYLALPMKPLCREDCRGLCPVCGINRNRGTCDCNPAWVDPRMEPLRKLRGGA